MVDTGKVGPINNKEERVFMSLLHRLNLSQKFIALGFIALLMVLLPKAETL